MHRPVGRIEAFVLINLSLHLRQECLAEVKSFRNFGEEGNIFVPLNFISSILGK